MPAVKDALFAATPSHVSDPWLPLRVAYGRAERTLAIKQFLDDRQVETFLPMTHKRVLIDGRRRIKLVPAIDNLLFVHAPEAWLKEAKRTCEPLLPLRFLMWHPHDALQTSHIISVTPRDMSNFMRVAAIDDDRVMFLGNKDFTGKIGRRVRVVAGLFKGVEGTIYRVKKDRRVVVTLDGVCSVAISCMNPDYLEEID